MLHLFIPLQILFLFAKEIYFRIRICFIYIVRRMNDESILVLGHTYWIAEKEMRYSDVYGLDTVSVSTAPIIENVVKFMKEIAIERLEWPYELKKNLMDRICI